MMNRATGSAKRGGAPWLKPRWDRRVTSGQHACDRTKVATPPPKGGNQNYRNAEETFRRFMFTALKHRKEMKHSDYYVGSPKIA